MKTISLLQPFASLIALGCKSIETRSRDLSGGYRGVVGIHASRGTDYMHLCEQHLFSEALEHSGATIEQGICYYDGWHLPLGCIVAVADLVDVVRIRNEAQMDRRVLRHFGIPAFPYDLSREQAQRIDNEYTFGDYSDGRWMLFLSNVVALEKPVPARGRLGLWEFDLPDPREAAPHAT